jgi:hypothetical protein
VKLGYASNDGRVDPLEVDLNELLHAHRTAVEKESQSSADRNGTGSSASVGGGTFAGDELAMAAGAFLDVTAKVMDSAGQDGTVPTPRSVIPVGLLVSPPDAFELAVAKEHASLAARRCFLHLLPAVRADCHVRRLLRKTGQLEQRTRSDQNPR